MADYGEEVSMTKVEEACKERSDGKEIDLTASP